MAEFLNMSSAQLELPQTWPVSTSQWQDLLPGILAGWSTWQYIVMFLLSIVVYDQGNKKSRSTGFPH